jgi:hypothetical protein
MSFLDSCSLFPDFFLVKMKIALHSDFSSNGVYKKSVETTRRTDKVAFEENTTEIGI